MEDLPKSEDNNDQDYLGMPVHRGDKNHIFQLDQQDDIYCSDDDQVNQGQPNVHFEDGEGQRDN